MISCIIIEDEPLAMERLKEYVQKVPRLQLLATFDNALEGMDYLQHHEVDLLFLDINLDELTGIQLLENISFPGQVILTTAYDQYALKGFELNVTDYLLKPYSLSRFIQAVDKAINNLEQQGAKSNANFAFIKTENRLEKVAFDDLLYVEGMGDYRRLHTRGGRIMTLQTFGELEKLFPSSRFMRVHKSYLVSLGQVDSVERNRIRMGDVRIPISDTYRKTFFERIGQK